MFLKVMSFEEKEKFLEFVYKVANIDNEYAEEEQELILSYKNELGLDEIPETSNIDNLIKYFSKKTNEIKKIVLFETIGLINADDKIEKEEVDILEKMINSFDLENGVIEKIKSVAKNLQDVYDEVYNIIFD